MTWLKVLAGVALALFLVGRIRLGGEIEYGAEGLLVKVRFGWLRFQVFPLKKKKEERAPKMKKESSKKEKEPKSKAGGSLELIKKLLPLACQAAGELKRRIRIERLYLDLTVAAQDAAGAAMAYGYANMALGMLWPMIEQSFEVRDPRLHTGVDFTIQSPVIYISAAFSAQIGQLVSFGLRYGWKALRVYLQSRGNIKTRKEAV